ncbi:MAG: hypothetical protein M0T84_06410 [Betaproteobacteria bacterium]|nr:hypothetical protein [Betaproteobacteria bacterium]
MTDVIQATAEQIQRLRQRIPNDSQTAQAIDRDAPWKEIYASAEKEGFRELCATICLGQRDAQQNAGE